MKKKLLTVLQYLFFSAIAVFFIWLSLKGMDSQKWAQLKGALDHANYWLLIPVLLFCWRAIGSARCAGGS